jgi:alkaline phosphatase
VAPATDRNGVPYTALVYGNGPGYRGTPRVDPRTDAFPGRNGTVPNGPGHEAYFQEAAVPLGSETHAAEEVAIYAIGPGADLVHGTVKNTFIYRVMAKALGIAPRR